jgi:biopolymer transport protein ExbD
MAAMVGLMKSGDEETDASEEFSSTTVFVTPMLDMAFQLLAFFIFTYHPSALEGQFPIHLAQSEGGAEEPVVRPDQKASPQKPTETKPAVTVTARANMKGRLISLDVAAAGRTDPIRGPEGGGEVPIDYLLTQLSAKLREHKQNMPREDRLLLRGSLGLKWEDSMQVLDTCRKYKDKSGKWIDLFPKVEMDLIR